MNWLKALSALKPLIEGLGKRVSQLNETRARRKTFTQIRKARLKLHKRSKKQNWPHEKLTKELNIIEREATLLLGGKK